MTGTYSASYVLILLIDDMLDVLAVLLDLICHQDAGYTSANGQDLEFPILRAVVGYVRNGVRPVTLCM